MAYRHLRQDGQDPDPAGQENTILEPEELTRAHCSAYQELRPGDTVGGYRVEALLGAGTMGTVYRAVHPLIGKQVAIKVLKPELAADLEAVARFVREARVVNQIRHRNIIDIFNFDRLPSGQHYLIMEYLDGVSLRTMLEQQGPLPLDQALDLLRQVANALDAAHTRGIVHRDLKPDNIFLVRDERGEPSLVKLVDFGIAKLLCGEREEDTSWLRTETGALLGTPYYMSPEQCQGQRVDQSCDIYALGVVAYHMLTGQLPFQGRQVHEMLKAHISRQPPIPSRVNPSLPVGVDEPLLRALHKDPSQRPDSAQELISELEAAMTGPAIEPTRVERSIAVRTGSLPGEVTPATRPLTDEMRGLALSPAVLDPGLRPTVEVTPRGRRSGGRLVPMMTVMGLGLVVWGARAYVGLPVDSAMELAAVSSPVAEGRAEAGTGGSRAEVTLAARDRDDTPVLTGTQEDVALALAKMPPVPLTPERIGLEASDLPLRAAVPGASALVSIDAAQAGTEVWLDGRALGAVPCQVSLPPGEHRIQLRSPDGTQTRERTVVLEPGQRFRARYDFDRGRWLSPHDAP